MKTEMEKVQPGTLLEDENLNIITVTYVQDDIPYYYDKSKDSIQPVDLNKYHIFDPTVLDDDATFSLTPKGKFCLLLEDDFGVECMSEKADIAWNIFESNMLKYGYLVCDDKPVKVIDDPDVTPMTIMGDAMRYTNIKATDAKIEEFLKAFADWLDKE